ncbi:MAG: hypothetical protein KAR87_04450 [Candidatus Aenigmarchaeota archaeon]|nr:hypothetical protein [Candidatus Aenigmarchaeota archaeon]
MANYHYTPGRKKSDFKSNDGKISGFLKSLSKNKLKIAIGLMIIAVISFAGPGITGAFIYSDSEYDELSDNPDFPQLSKKDANLELYHCNGDLSKSSSDLDKCNLFLSDAHNTFSACTDQKESIESELQTAKDNYNSCTSNEDSCKSNLNTCNSDKAVKESHLATCNTLLKEKDIKYRDYESERDEIISNYANSVCCTLKQLSNPSLRYYNVVDNKVVCSENEGEDFNC